MGTELEASSGYAGSPREAPIRDDSSEDGQQPSPSEWRTPPLWGVADSAPYLHDGRSATLESAIVSHGGEASGVTNRYNSLSAFEKQSISSFLKTLRAPASDGPALGFDKVAAR
jgi:cytochrome c peroxidase